jgi:hypothetical protein
VASFQALEKANLLHLEEVAVVTRDLDGTVTSEEVGDPWLSGARRAA